MCGPLEQVNFAAATPGVNNYAIVDTWEDGRFYSETKLCHHTSSTCTLHLMHMILELVTSLTQVDFSHLEEGLK